jgi:hypothetical protein
MIEIAHPIKEFFTESEWDLIYSLVVNNREFCEDEEQDPVEDYYSISDKIVSLFGEIK